MEKFENSFLGQSEPAALVTTSLNVILLSLLTILSGMLLAIMLTF